MTLKEFKKQAYYTREHIVIPSMNRLKLSKYDFFEKGKYQPKLVDQYLEELYNKQYKE